MTMDLLQAATSKRLHYLSIGPPLAFIDRGRGGEGSEPITGISGDIKPNLAACIFSSFQSSGKAMQK
jgi:hypothetical protein